MYVLCVRIQYLSFYFWLTSLCIIGSRFVHLIRTDSNAFLFIAESIVYMYHNFFIHSSVDGHLHSFHVLAIVNSAVMNNGIYVSFSILVSSGYMPRSGIISGFLVLLYWSICVFLCQYFMSHSFDCGGFVGNFEVVKCEFFNFVFFFFHLPFFFFICGGFCHTLKWNSQGFTCVPHPNPPSHLPLHPFPLGFPSAPGPSTCLMHPAWAGGLFHPR